VGIWWATGCLRRDSTLFVTLCPWPIPTATTRYYLPVLLPATFAHACVTAAFRTFNACAALLRYTYPRCSFIAVTGWSNSMALVFAWVGRWNGGRRG